ncbi:MAG: exosome complex exonuclease Rrp41 [Methanomassiliicoccaceae archaeon]|nr:exosome complex exonuclease Rrp41 [Methanomassiliicoccaceae archaeon]
MSGQSDLELVNKKGIRLDGRKAGELRNIKIEAGVLENADGSAYVEIGKNKVRAAVYGPRECHPRHLQDPTKAIIQCKYNMMAFSVSDRKRPGPDRRSVEISKIIAEALEAVVLTELYPRASIDVYIEILQANAGTRCAGLTAASVALADAGIPMKDIIPAVAVGKADGKVLLDLNKEEDNFGQADVPLALIPKTNEIVLLQMDGNMTRDEFDKAIEMGVAACHEIYELQKDALRRRYSAALKDGDSNE